jgi:nucleoside-diphosphate-sugar epimerase
MKNIVITGTNGMIGRLILEKCLQRNDVSKITSITRKPVGIKHEKLVEIIHQDFSDFTTIVETLKNQDVCFYCLGVYTGKVPTVEFKKITVGFTKAFSEALRHNNENTTFCFLSGQGADTSEKSVLLFAMEKGIAENNLLKLKFKETYIFRPGYIYPVTPRPEPNFFYRVMRRIYKPVSKIYPNLGLTSTQLAATMVNVGLKGGDKVIYENKNIREY